VDVVNVRDRKMLSIVAAPLAVVALAVGVAVAVSVGDGPRAAPAAPAPSMSETAPPMTQSPMTQPPGRQPPGTQPPATRRPVGPVRPWTELGYVTRAWVSSGTLRVTIDRVLWLTGEAATEANGGEEPPNGFVIVNDNPRLRTYASRRRRPSSASAGSGTTTTRRASSGSRRGSSSGVPRSPPRAVSPSS
jgi:hypothetical protein